jgi:hypothetical protein
MTLTLNPIPEETQETPAELIARWQAAGLLTGYGDPDKTFQEVARELRETFSRREHGVRPAD